jgi:hypothetical protein
MPEKFIASPQSLSIERKGFLPETLFGDNTANRMCGQHPARSLCIPLAYSWGAGGLKLFFGFLYANNVIIC